MHDQEKFEKYVLAVLPSLLSKDYKYHTFVVAEAFNIAQHLLEEFAERKGSQEREERIKKHQESNGKLACDLSSLARRESL